MTSGEGGNSISNNKDSGSNNITIKRSTFNKIVIVAVAALMIASFFGGYDLGGGGKTTSEPSGIASQLSSSSSSRISSISLNGSHILGKPDAPIALIEFTDFQCPFCGRFFSDTFPQIKTNYIDTGKIKFVVKEFPLTDLHPNARAAANAAECANEQGKFWQYQEALFGNQTSWADQDAIQAINTLKKYAGDLRLNSASFNSCLGSMKYAHVIDKDSQEGSKDGVSGTPTFYIGNQRYGYTQLVGAHPFSTFQQTLDQAIQQKHQ